MRRSKSSQQAPKTTEFFDALRDGNVRRVRALLQKEAVDVNVVDQRNSLRNTALIIACARNNTDMVVALSKAKNRKLNVNHENIDGKRAIWWATRHCNEKVAAILLERECDVNFIDKETGCTPLYEALLMNSASLCRLLVHAGADVNLRKLGLQDIGEAPLHKAVQMGNLEIVDLFANSLCNLEARTEDGFTALHYAVSYRRYAITKYLLSIKSDLHAATNHGATCMTMAIQQHNPVMCRILIENGYEMDREYAWQERPLQQAIRVHSEECAMTLVHMGCSLTMPGNGTSYFSHACEEGLLQLARLLCDIKPDYLNEDWIRTKTIPLALYKEPDFCEVLYELASKPRLLFILCRARIFKCIGKHSPGKIKTLPLPNRMKTFISCTEYFPKDFYKEMTLDDPGCPFDCLTLCNLSDCPDIDISSSDSGS